MVELIATRDLAVEAAAIETAANTCNESDGWDMHPKDYYKLVRRLITPPHATALEAHDRELTAKLVAASCSNPNVVKEVLREREDRMLKRFEDLAGTLKWISGGAHFSHELFDLIASIRKERE